jgi:hypothetical protein
MITVTPRRQTAAQIRGPQGAAAHHPADGTIEASGRWAEPKSGRVLLERDVAGLIDDDQAIAA